MLNVSPPTIINRTILPISSTSVSDGNILCLNRLVRVFIGDTDKTRFTDEYLAEIIKYAFFAVKTELFNCGYVSSPSIDVCVEVVNFDPCDYPSFTNLVALKAACLINQNQAIGAAKRGSIKAVCGPASIDINVAVSTIQSFLEAGPCKGYNDLKEELCTNCNAAILEACGQVVSVFTSSIYFTDGWRYPCHS